MNILTWNKNEPSNKDTYPKEQYIWILKHSIGFGGTLDNKIMGEVVGTSVKLYDPCIKNKLTALDLTKDNFKYLGENAFNRAHEELLEEVCGNGIIQNQLHKDQNLSQRIVQYVILKKL